MRRPTSLARLMRGTAAVLTAVATLTLSTIGGLTYLWCGPMQEARLHCCCPADEADSGHEMVRRECCEARVVAELPAGTSVDEPATSIAPIALDLTWVASIDATFFARAVVAPPPAARARAGPVVRVHRHCSVYLL